MRVFISSLITGFENERAAAKEAIETLGHEALMAEDLQSQPHSPQIACLQAVRQADLVVLILGRRYGWISPTSQISPTHEEFREAKGKKTILVFVEAGAEFEVEQRAFVEEAGDWSQGHLYKTYDGPDDLRRKVTRSLADQALATAVGPVDEVDLTKRLVALFPERQRNVSGAVAVDVAMTAGPSQTLLRPVEIEDAELSKALQQQALFGEPEIFETSSGIEIDQGRDLSLKQPNGAMVRLTEQGSIFVRLPLDRSSRQTHGFGMMAIIQEQVDVEMNRALAYVSWLLDHIDSTQKTTHIAVGARIVNAGHCGWRTQAEQDANPNSASMGMGGQSNDEPVQLVTPRAALNIDRRRMVEDLIVPLRRQFHQA